MQILKITVSVVVMIVATASSAVLFPKELVPSPTQSPFPEFSILPIAPLPPLTTFLPSSPSLKLSVANHLSARYEEVPTGVPQPSHSTPFTGLLILFILGLSFFTIPLLFCVITTRVLEFQNRNGRAERLEAAKKTWDLERATMEMEDLNKIKRREEESKKMKEEGLLKGLANVVVAGAVNGQGSSRSATRVESRTEEE